MPADRAKRNREMRMDALREELKAREYLTQIANIAQILNDTWEEIGLSQVAALRLHAELNFKRLAKILPDLKAIDITGLIQTEDVTDRLTDLERTNQIAGIFNAARERAVDGVIESSPAALGTDGGPADGGTAH